MMTHLFILIQIIQKVKMKILIIWIILSFSNNKQYQKKILILKYNKILNIKQNNSIKFNKIINLNKINN